MGISGAFLYRVEVFPGVDAYSGNNSMQAWTEVLGPPRVLLISPYQPDPVGEQLESAGFEVLTVSYPEELTIGSLSSTKAVIINNTAANKIAPDFLSALPFFVEHQGGGLFMIGGEDSLGAGGYYGSSIDPLLPVSLELRSEHLRFASAMYARFLHRWFVARLYSATVRYSNRLGHRHACIPSTVVEKSVKMFSADNLSMSFVQSSGITAAFFYNPKKLISNSYHGGYF